MTHPLVKSGRVVSLCFTEISHRGPKLKEGGSGTVWYYPTLMPNVVFNHAFGHLPPVSTLRVGGGSSSRSSRDGFSGTMVARTREIHLPMA